MSSSPHGSDVYDRRDTEKELDTGKYHIHVFYTLLTMEPFVTWLETIAVLGLEIIVSWRP